MASSINVYNLAEAQKGYLAAFIDGEGGIQVTRSLRRDREYSLALHPDVYFTNTNEAVIRTIRNWLGGGSVTRRPAKENNSDTYVLTISGVKSILELLEAIRPMLIVKAERADLMIEYCRSRISQQGKRPKVHQERAKTIYSNQEAEYQRRRCKQTPTHGSLTKAGNDLKGRLESGVRRRS
jgi:hypothetical protein